MAALKRGFSQTETLLLSRGQTSDPTLRAVVQLAKSLAEKKGGTDETLAAAFFQAGYNEAADLELIGPVTVRIFTKYVYAFTDIPVDFPAAEPLEGLSQS